MADLTFDDMFEESAVEVEKPKPTTPRLANQSWIITPEVQAQRDAAAGALLRHEAGGVEGLQKRIELIDSELQTANPDKKGILLRQKKLHQAGLTAPDRQVSLGGELSFDDMFEEEKPKAPEPRSELDIQLRGVQAGGAAILKEAGTMGDMLLGDVPGGLIGVAANFLSRFYAPPEGVSRKATAVVQRDIQREVAEKYSPHLFSKFAALFAPPGEDVGEGHIEKSMAALMAMTDGLAEKIEVGTDGALKKEDVQVLVDETFALLGVKGVQLGTQSALNRALAKDPKAAKKIFAVDEVRDAPSVPGMAPADVPAGRASIRALPPEEMATLQSAEKKALEAKRRDVEAAVREDPAWADQLNAIAESAARNREMAAIERERLAISQSAPRTRPAERVEAQERAQNIETQLRPYQNLRLQETSALDSGLQKIAKGQGFALTAEELAAVRTSKSVWNRPKIEGGQADIGLLTAIALGTTGASLAFLYPDEREVGAGALTAGLLATPWRRRLTYEKLREMPEGRSLGTILAESPYTLKTLELPELQNRVEIPKSMLEQAVKREGVTKVERELIEGIVKSTDKPMLTAKELMTEVKLRTGDWELVPEDVQQHADYGIDQIGRRIESSPGPDATRTDWNYPEGVNIDPLIEAIESNPNRHIYGRRALGHTRAFEEGGVRHVVEVQSNLAQHIAKAKAEVGLDAPFAKALSRIEPTLKDWHKRLIREELASGAMRIGELQKLSTEKEFQAKRLLENVANNPGWPETDVAYLRERIDANLKESLDLRAKIPNAQKMRFATADTVAKVEGWKEVGGATYDARVAGIRRRINRYQNDVTALEDIQAGRTPSYGPYSALRIADPLAYERLRTSAADLTYVRSQLVAAREYLKELESNPPTTRFSPEHQGIYDRYHRDVEKFLKQLGAKPYTDKFGHTWLEISPEPLPKGKRAQMFGAADPKLLAAIAAVGTGGLVGAYLSDDKTIGPAAGALLGGLAIFAGSRYPVVREYAKESIAKTDYTLGLISTRIYEQSPALHRRHLDFEIASLAKGHEKLEAAHDFIRSAKRLKGEEASAFKRAALTNDPAIITKTLNQIGDQRLTSGWNTIRKILDEQGASLVEAKLLKGLRENYFPRSVKDKAGLFEKLGKEERTFLESKLARAEAASIKKNGHGLTELDSAAIINEYLSTEGPTGSRPSFLKKRTIGEVTKELEPFYDDPGETVVSYIRRAESEIQKARYFGKHLRTTDLEGRKVIDLEASIGELVGDLLKRGEIKPEGVEEVRSILSSRFGPGETSSWGIVQDFRNAAYIGLLGNFISAAIQTTDIGINVALRGLTPTLEAVGRKLTGRQLVSVRELGLLDHVAEEFAGQRPSSKALRLVFKGAGFATLDAFSKDVAVNSALLHRRNQLRSSKGEAQFDSDLARSYGKDLAQLKSDLRGSKKTDLTNSLAFAELSRTQPVSRAEVPQMYLDNPNGRTMYMLKTYSLKQADLLRQESYMKIKEGKVKEGLTSLAKIGTAFMLAGATSQWVSDWMSGRDFTPEWSDLPAGFFKTFGLSQYVLDTAETRGPAAALGNIVMPPTKMIDDIALGKEKAVRYIPFGGRLHYEHNLGGAEAFKAREVLRRRQEEREADLSEEEKEDRRERLKERAAERRRRLAEEY